MIVDLLKSLEEGTFSDFGRAIRDVDIQEKKAGNRRRKSLTKVRRNALVSIALLAPKIPSLALACVRKCQSLLSRLSLARSFFYEKENLCLPCNTCPRCLTDLLIAETVWRCVERVSSIDGGESAEAQSEADPQRGGLSVVRGALWSQPRLRVSWRSLPVGLYREPKVRGLIFLPLSPVHASLHLSRLLLLPGSSSASWWLL